MRLLKKKSGYLHCFSPEVMLGTFLIEIFLGIAILFRTRFRLSQSNCIILLILILLASFQGIEYLICETNIDKLLLGKLGFFSITLLPPLGIHLAYSLAQQKRHPYILVPYMTAFIVNVLFVISPLTVQNVMCHGNYVIFDLPFILQVVYGFYYQGFLLYGLMTAFHLSHDVKTNERAQRLRWLGVGYILFMMPTAVILLLRTETIDAIPSVMCGFALILAFILYLKVFRSKK
jgi:hypothetical protein